MHSWTHRILVVLTGFFFMIGFGILAHAQDDHTLQETEESAAIQGSENAESELSEAAHGAEDVEAAHDTEDAESGEFNPGDFIFDHIKDSHEWHITEIKGKPVSIPLPVILYSNTKGLLVFISSKFEHGHASYKGFRLETGGENKGKIVDEDGSLPLDLSITKNVASIFFSLIILFWIFLSAGKAYKKNPMGAPKGVQSLVEPVIVFIRDDVAIPSIGEKKYERFMPFLLTIFFFILVNNLLGLIPIPPAGANVTGNIAVTFVLALFTMIITNFSGNRNYWTHIFNTKGVPVWLKLPVPLMPLVETIGVITKPFVLMLRLFANIAAGHILAMGIFGMIFIFAQMAPYIGYSVSVISVLFDVFMIFVEMLISFIQAFIFTILSAIYIGMAVEEHH